MRSAMKYKRIRLQRDIGTNIDAIQAYKAIMVFFVQVASPIVIHCEVSRAPGKIALSPLARVE